MNEQRDTASTAKKREPVLPHHSRSMALFFVLFSGILLFLFSFPLQILAWWLEPMLQSLYGTELPAATRIFVDLFGRQGESYLSFVFMSLWWILVWIFIDCNFRYPEPEKFGPEFHVCLMGWWYFVFLFLGVIFFIGSLGFITLGRELSDPPFTLIVISWVLTVLPLLVLIATIRLFLTKKRLGKPVRPKITIIRRESDRKIESFKIDLDHWVPWADDTSP